MRYKTVKGLLNNEYIISDDKVLWLSKPSKCKCKGYFLLKFLGFRYELLKALREKEE